MVDNRIHEPHKAHEGVSSTFCTSAALLPWPLWRWDVNGYYRALDVVPTANRRQLREAFQRLHGDQSDRLTYIMGQLLDPIIRARYDACAPGEVFIDRYVLAEVIRRAQDQASKAIRDGQAQPADAVDLDLDDALGSPVSVLDQPPLSGHTTDPHPWGYYRWNTVMDQPHRLDRWRTVLSAAFWLRGVNTHVAVGLAKSMEPWQVETVETTTVFFINEDTEPTQLLAEAAVDHHIKNYVSTPRR